MVVQLQDGSCCCLNYHPAGYSVKEIPDKAKPKKHPLRDQIVRNDPDYIVYKVNVDGHTAGIYTGESQAERIIKEFNQAMDDGGKSFTFPPDKPEKKGIFKP